MEKQFHEAIRQERISTVAVLKLINEAEESRYILERGFSSMHDFLITECHYSEGAANRRVQAARMMKTLPEVQARLENGALNLSVLAMAQSFTKGETAERKRAIVQKLENKSSKEAERILAGHYPSRKRKEHIEAIDANTYWVSLEMSLETLQQLKALQDEMAHTCQTLSEVVAKIAAEKHRARKRCAYQDPLTGRRCTSHYKIEKDHIHPKGLGGSSEPPRAKSPGHHGLRLRFFSGKKLRLRRR